MQTCRLFLSGLLLLGATRALAQGEGKLASNGALVTVGGCFVAVASWLMRRQALVPVRDPRLAESLAFENA